jgi:fluoroquinolone transport system ATP-binding protein
MRPEFITDANQIEQLLEQMKATRRDARTVKVEYAEDGETSSATFPMETIKTPEFHQLLATKNIETLHSGETTLEDIFVKIVGVQLHA